MKKIILLFLFATITMFLVSGCDNSETATDTKTQDVFNVSEDVASDYIGTTRIFIDKETGVNYIYVCSGQGIQFVPRYNADGTIYTSDTEEK